MRLDRRNVDCTIKVKSTTASVANYTASGTNTFNVTNNGIHRVELWGAAGNYNPGSMQDQVGAGAYTKGEIRLTTGNSLIVNVGEQKTGATNFNAGSFNANSGSVVAGGFRDANGNPTTTSCDKSGNCYNSSGGGGATDVRINNDLNSRIMVAAGGGGNVYFKAGEIVGIGGDGGGLVGYYAGTYGTYYTSAIVGQNIVEADSKVTAVANLQTPHDFTFGGTQKKAGLTNAGSQGGQGTFGVGGAGYGIGAAGGGGYYGGGGGGPTRSYNNSHEGYAPGAGGSSFIAGHTGSISTGMANDGRCGESTLATGGSVYRPENYLGTTANACSYVYVNNKLYVFNDTVMIDGRGYSWTNVRGGISRMPDPPTGGTARYGTTKNGVGNIGGGAARITYPDYSKASATATWTKKATIHVYVRNVDMNGNNLTSPEDHIMAPEEDYCYYGADLAHREFNRVEIVPQNYDVCGVTGDEDIHITYFYDLDSHNVITMYLDKYYYDSTIENADSTSYKHGSNYSTSCKTIPGYSLVEHTGSDLTGVVDDDKVIRCYYAQRITRIIVKYLEEGTNTVLSEETELTKAFGEDYSVTPLSIRNYKKVRVDGLEQGICNQDEITVTYYYKLQKSNIFVNHLDCVTGEALRDQEVINTFAGTQYDVTDRIRRDIDGYYLDYVPGNATGTYQGGEYEHPITVTYRYCKRDAVVVANYLENVTNKVLAPRYEHGVNNGDEYETHPKDIKYYQLVSTIGDFEHGTVVKALTTVNYYYERKPGTLTVKYLDYDTNNELSPTERTNVKWGNNYQTTSKNIQNYYVFKIQGAPAGVIEGDETEVIYYYKRSAGIVTVRYLDDNTNNSLLDNITINHYYGETYTTEQKVIPNYEFVRVHGTPNGIFGGNITVIYYYRLKDAKLTVRHLDIDTNQELYPTTTRNIKWYSSYQTEQRAINGYNYVKVEGQPSGRVDSDDLVVTYYYSRKTFKLTVRHLEYGTNTILGDTETSELRYQDSYTTLPKVIADYRVYQVPTNANGRLVSDTTVTYYYVKKDGELVVRYVDEETGENIIPAEVTAVDFGDYYESYSYENGRKQFAYYDFSRVVGTEKGNIELEHTEVIYYYRIKRGRVVAKYLDIENNEELIDSKQENYRYGESYITHEETIDGYRLDHIEGVESGTFEGDVEVRYYYKRIRLTVTIHYKEDGTENKIANDSIQNKQYGERYTTSKIDIENYLYTRVVGNERGTVVSDVEVTYYYKKRDAKIIVKYLEKETNRPLSPQEEIDAKWGEQYDTESLVIDNYKVIEYPTNAYGTVNQNEIVVIYYYGHRDAVVVARYLEDGTNKEIASQERRGYNYGESYFTFQKSVYSYEYVRVEGEPYGIVNEDEINVTYFYRKTTRKLTIRYLELDTEKKIAADEEEVMDYGTYYQTSVKNLDNYYYYRVVGNEVGKLENDTVVTYYYVRKTATLTVRHLDFETKAELASEEVSTVRYGEEYETHRKEIKYYDYNSVSGLPTGVVDSDNIVVEYYYIQKPSEVISYYMDVANNHELADHETQMVTYGEYYITKPSGGVPKNYEFLRKTPNYEGLATDDVVEVYYYYQKIDSNVSTSIDLYGTDTIEAVDGEVNYYIEYNATVNDYIGDGKITIVDKLPYSIIEEKCNFDGGVYNEDDNTVTWVIDWKNINSFENENEITVEKNISVTFNGIKSTERVFNNNVSGTLKLDNNERTVENDLATRVMVTGTIIVHHYLESTNNQLFLDEIVDGLVGDTYITHEQTIEGFELIRRPFQETLTFKDQPFEVIYEYRKKRLHVTIEVTGGIGEVSGEEEVLYEGDSTPENIVITPANDYEIESIIINGEEIEVTDPKEMTLDNFVKMTEDKKIEVTFTEATISVPITGKNSNILAILAVLVIIGATVILLHPKKKKKLIIER